MGQLWRIQGNRDEQTPGLGVRGTERTPTLPNVSIPSFCRTLPGRRAVHKTHDYTPDWNAPKSNAKRSKSQAGGMAWGAKPQVKEAMSEAMKKSIEKGVKEAEDRARERPWETKQNTNLLAINTEHGIKLMDRKANVRSSSVLYC